MKYEFALPLYLERVSSKIILTLIIICVEMILTFHLQQSCIWSRGPFPAKTKHDGTLFRGGELHKPRDTWDKDALFNHIPKGKKVIGDNSYGGTHDKSCVALEGHSEEALKQINRAKAREENYHKLMKDFDILWNRFRHGTNGADRMEKHRTVVQAIHVILYFELVHRPIMDM